MNRIDKCIEEVERDYMMEQLHMDQFKYTDIVEENEHVKKIAEHCQNKLKLLTQTNEELEAMLKIMTKKFENADRDNMHYNRRNAELVLANGHLEEKIDNLEIQLRELMLNNAEVQMQVERILFDQDLLESLNNEEESQMEVTSYEL
jgi:hypothetical protein